jgi:hypothetical protein
LGGPQGHWKLKNSFVHEGKAGLFMLGYDPKYDRMANEPFLFGERDREMNHKCLLEEIPRVIPKDGIHADHLFRNHCNNTTATFDMFKESIGCLYYHRDIEVFTNGGSKKQKGAAIRNDDFIRPNRQLRIIF